MIKQKGEVAMRFGQTFLASFVMMALVYGSGSAVAQTVTAGAGGEYASLQAAIDAVAADTATRDKITVVGDLEDVENVTIPDSVPGITIEAQNPGQVTMRAGLVVWAPNATINGLNLDNTGGTGLDIAPGAGNVTFSNARCTNVGGQGVAAANAGTSFTLNNVTIESTNNNGLLIAADVQATLNNCTIRDSREQQILVNENAVVNINDCVVESGRGNGLFHIQGGTSNVKNCIFRDNSGQQIIVERGGRINLDDCEVGPSNFNGLFTTFQINDPGEYIVARNCRLHNNRERGAVTESGGIRLINCDVYENGDGVQAFSHGIHAEYCRIYRNNALGFFTVSQRETKPAVSTIDHCDVFANGNNIYLGGGAVADVKITATYNIVSLAIDRGMNQDGNMDGLPCDLINSNNLVVEEGPLANTRSFAGLAEPGEGTLFVDPQYVNVGPNVATKDLDFRVKPGSPAILGGGLFIGSMGTGGPSSVGDPWLLY